jgi:hypothetical protein
MKVILLNAVELLYLQYPVIVPMMMFGPRISVLGSLLMAAVLTLASRTFLLVLATKLGKWCTFHASTYKIV